MNVVSSPISLDLVVISYISQNPIDEKQRMAEGLLHLDK